MKNLLFLITGATIGILSSYYAYSNRKKINENLDPVRENLHRRARNIMHNNKNLQES